MIRTGIGQLTLTFRGSLYNKILGYRENSIQRFAVKRQPPSAII